MYTIANTIDVTKELTMTLNYITNNTVLFTLVQALKYKV